MSGSWSDVLAAVLAVHQRRSMGMTSNSADVCACGQRISPARALHDFESIENRRDRAMGEHQAERASLVVTVGGPS